MFDRHRFRQAAINQPASCVHGTNVAVHHGIVASAQQPCGRYACLAFPGPASDLKTGCVRLDPQERLLLCARKNRPNALAALSIGAHQHQARKQGFSRQVHRHAIGQCFWIQQPVFQFERMPVLAMHDHRVKQRPLRRAAEERRLRRVSLDDRARDDLGMIDAAPFLDLLDHVTMRIFGDIGPWRRDISPGAAAANEEALRGQVPQGVMDRHPARTENLGQLAFGRDAIALFPHAPHDLRDNVRGNPRAQALMGWVFHGKPIAQPVLYRQIFVQLYIPILDPDPTFTARDFS